MPETSRDVVVVLLDETSFTVPVKPTLLGSELLDMAASHCKVKEKEYFSLMTDGDGYKNWLELDKPVLDPSQDLPKGTGHVRIYFTFKYFVDQLRHLQDFMTVELLYLHSRQAIMKGEILTDDETVFELAACALQAQYGEYKSEKETLQQLKSLKVIPPSIFAAKSVHECENYVLGYYRMMRTLSRGEAIIKYLEIIQTLPMYSMHYFDVKDKKDVPLWLGVGPDGIIVSSSTSKTDLDPSLTHRLQWVQLQNIYYRDRKFSMEVYQSSKVNKKGSLGPVSVNAWYGSSAKVVMAIWKMARDQHMFYRSKRASRSPHVQVMNPTDIIRHLNKLHSANISPSSSHSSLSVESARSNQIQASAEAVAAAKAAQNEMYQALLTKRAALVAEFEAKAARYKDLLVKEMQITGIPPHGLTPEEIEKMRKKFGVSFKFSKFVLDDSTVGDQEVEELEKQLEIQSSIIEASKTLLSQANNRRLKKDRKKEIKEAQSRYHVLEDRLQDMKRSKKGSAGVSSSSRFHVDSPTNSTTGIQAAVLGGARPLLSGSVDDSYLSSIIFDSPSSSSEGYVSGGMHKSPHHKSTSALSDLQHDTGSSSSSTPSHPPSSHFHNYPPHSRAPPPPTAASRSFNSDHRSVHSPSYYHDDRQVSPPLAVVTTSANTGGGVIHHVRPGLRDIDLASEILNHYSRDRRHVTPPPCLPGDYVSPHHPPLDSRAHYPAPYTSSPIKRNSSPDIGVTMPARADFLRESESPDLYLPAPELDQYKQGPPQRGYPAPQPGGSSHHPRGASPGRNAYSNPASRSNSKPNFKPAMAGAGPQPVPNPHWYDGTAPGQAPPPAHRQQYSDVVPHRDGIAQYRDGTVPFRDGPAQLKDGYAGPRPVQQLHPRSNIPLPRRYNEDTLDIQEFLQTVAESKTNPFGEGTLV